MMIVFLQIARLRVVNEIRLRLHRLFGIEVRGQDFILDVDEFERLLGDRFRNGNHAGYVVAHVAHLVERQRIFVVAHGQNAVRIRCILSHRNRNDPFALLRSARVYALYASVRIRRMQNLADQHAGQAEVVGVLARAGGFPGRVDHRGGLADNGEIAHPVIPSILSFRAKRGIWCSPRWPLHSARAIPLRSASTADRMASYIWL